MKYEDFLKRLNDCPFCNFNKGWVIKENNSAILALSRAYDSKDHLVIFPKKCARKLCELNLNEKNDLVELIFFGHDKLKEIYSHLSILYREGDLKKIGKSVEHLHVQIIPTEIVRCLNSPNRKIYSPEEMVKRTEEFKKI